MALYRLRVSRRRPDGRLGPTSHKHYIEKDSLIEAIEEANQFPIDKLFDQSDFAWMTNSDDEIVWVLRVEET